MIRFDKKLIAHKISILILLSSALCTYAAECTMSADFQQINQSVPSGKTSVWSSADKQSMLWVGALNVNTDGTRRSYSVDDFWGEKTALNNLCNAMDDACANLNTSQMRDRRIATQEAYKAGWPKDQLKSVKISSSIIPFKDGKPCPLVEGYLVSATALHKTNITDVCDINNYADALTTSAIVIPKNTSSVNATTGKLDVKLSEFAKRNAKVGDLVVTILPGKEQVHFAVIGDTGPAKKLGEGSIALNGRLLNRTSEPVNYKQIRDDKQGLYVNKSVVLIFPGTRDVPSPFMTQSRIDEESAKVFAKWGGVDRLKACAEKYIASSK
jgi:hypothetical protein